ncbi:MAG: dipeptide/oligopeptide/nickel ABC transporter ATP-binding protein, partial [Clostridia bacterium]|nr:dipeptide/oligopeptide/nickel ABC transporter ATP-binding protein [Clostridia bacterium]
MSDILIETRNLKKFYRTSAGMLHAVDGVNLAIEKGKTLGVVGESGCGKSTLGRTLLRLESATGGEVFFNGQNILKMKPAEFSKVREKMQMIFQDPYSSLNPRMTIERLISEPLLINRGGSRAEVKERVAELMDLVGLAPAYADSYPHELDGGRRQRIGVARALALDPDFVVCDEPVSALDVSIQAQILNLLMDLQDKL